MDATAAHKSCIGLEINTASAVKAHPLGKKMPERIWMDMMSSILSQLFPLASLDDRNESVVAELPCTLQLQLLTFQQTSLLCPQRGRFSFARARVSSWCPSTRLRNLLFFFGLDFCYARNEFQSNLAGYLRPHSLALSSLQPGGLEIDVIILC